MFFCTSRIAVVMTDSRVPAEGAIRRGNSWEEGGAGSALEGGSSTDRSLTILLILAVSMTASSSAASSSIDLPSSRDSLLMGRAGSDLPVVEL